MSYLGYKIVDKDRQQVESVVNRALEQSRPLEVGLYFADRGAMDYLSNVLPESDVPVNTHLNHLEVSLLSAVENEAELRKQIEQSLLLGSSYSVTHVYRLPTTTRPAQMPALRRSLEESLWFVEEICSEYSYRIHLENVFHELDFYRDLFAKIRQLGLTRIHTCFDLGHAKVWSGATLPEWIDWLQVLDDQGFKAHFHLHANNGLFDQHLSFVEAVSQNLTEADSYTDGLDYFSAITQLNTLFPESRKVFEVPVEQALQNLQLVESRIASCVD